MTQLGRLLEFVKCANVLGPTLPDKLSIFWRQTKNVRVRLGLASYRPHSIYQLDTRYGRLHFRDNFGDVTNLVGLYYRQVYRPHALTTEGAIVDVGANVGLAAALFAHHNPGRAIHCFEPLEDNTRLIRLNCPKAVVHPVAVGAEEGEVSLAVDEHSIMASTIDCRWDTSEQRFRVMSLDTFAAEEAIDRVALLKIDTEGMEVDILTGAREMLSRTQEVALETHGRERHDAVLSILHEAGFQLDHEEFGPDTGFILASRPLSSVRGAESVAAAGQAAVR